MKVITNHTGQRVRLMVEKQPDPMPDDPNPMRDSVVIELPAWGSASVPDDFWAAWVENNSDSALLAGQISAT